MSTLGMLTCLVGAVAGSFAAKEGSRHCRGSLVASTLSVAARSLGLLGAATFWMCRGLWHAAMSVEAACDAACCCRGRKGAPGPTKGWCDCCCVLSLTITPRRSPQRGNGNAYVFSDYWPSPSPTFVNSPLSFPKEASARQPVPAAAAASAPPAGGKDSPWVMIVSDSLPIEILPHGAGEAARSSGVPWK